MSSPCSGSTLLDIALSNHPAVFGAGELCKLLDVIGRHDESCACGSYADCCTFWSDVCLTWSGRNGAEDRQSYAILQNHYERIRNLPRLWLRKSPTDTGLGRYRKGTQALYAAIRDVTGKGIIVDSSKSPVRALTLAGEAGIDLYVVHLVRDVRGVACSHLKDWEPDGQGDYRAVRSSERPSVVALKWMLFNHIAERICSRLGERAITIRYEDLIHDPAHVLNRIGSLTGMDFADVAARLAGRSSLYPGHQVAGNRLRMKHEIRLNPDASWRRELAPFYRRFLPLLTYPVAARYGYHATTTA